MQGPPHLALPGQGVNELMQLHRDLNLREGFAVLVEELEVGNEPKRVSHRDHPGLHLDPVPGDARGLLRGGVPPERLAGAR